MSINPNDLLKREHIAFRFDKEKKRIEVYERGNLIGYVKTVGEQTYFESLPKLSDEL